MAKKKANTYPLRLTQGDITGLKHIATRTNSNARTGVNVGNPSINNLVVRIARNDLKIAGYENYGFPIDSGALKKRVEQVKQCGVNVKCFSCGRNIKKHMIPVFYIPKNDGKIKMCKQCAIEFANLVRDC